jgi:hypothetical protein
MNRFPRYHMIDPINRIIRTAARAVKARESVAVAVVAAPACQCRSRVPRWEFQAADSLEAVEATSVYLAGSESGWMLAVVVD